MAIKLSLAILLSLIAINEAFKQSSYTGVVRTNLHMTAHNQVPISPLDSSRNSAKNMATAAAFFLPLLSYSRESKAGLFSSPEQDMIDKISTYQKPVFDLVDQLTPGKTQVLKGGVEDSNVVQQYLNIYFIPLQKEMIEIASKLKLKEPADQARVEILPLLMKGHILELTQAVKETKAPSQLKETKEVQETLVEFLKLSMSDYKVVAYVPLRPFTDKEFFGPFGCEYWGKKRIEGTNTCAVIPEEKKS